MFHTASAARMLACLALTAICLTTPATPAHAADCDPVVPVAGDINCDGRADWAVGIPTMSSNRGAVEWRLGEDDFGTITTSSLGLGAGVAGERFGASVVIDDTNNDGYADLIIGAPGYMGHGTVYLAYGSATGIVSAGARRIAMPGIASSVDPRFGTSVGLVRHSGTVQRLLVGAPGWDKNADSETAMITDVGAVFATNLSTTGTVGVWAQYGQGSSAEDEAGDKFGAPLYVRGKTFIVGAAYENVGSVVNAGQATVTRLEWATDHWYTRWTTNLHQNTALVPGSNAKSDHFGAAVTIGTNGPTYDYVVGIPDKNIGSDTNTGAVVRFYLNDTTGALASANRYHQDSAGVPGTNEDNDRFGAAVASGYDWWNERPLLFVGAPGEDVGSKNSAGAVTLLRGTPTVSGIALRQGDRLGGTAEAGDKVGATLALLPDDQEEDSVDGIVVGAPGENVGSVVDAGYVMLDHSVLSFNFTGYPALPGSVLTGLKFGSVLGYAK